MERSTDPAALAETRDALDAPAEVLRSHREGWPKLASSRYAPPE